MNSHYNVIDEKEGGIAECAYQDRDRINKVRAE